MEHIDYPEPVTLAVPDATVVGGIAVIVVEVLMSPVLSRLVAFHKPAL